MRRKFVSIVLCGIIVASTIGCGNNASDAMANEAETEVVQLEDAEETNEDMVLDAEKNNNSFALSETEGSPLYEKSGELQISTLDWAEDLAGTIVDVSVYPSTVAYVITDDGAVYKGQYIGGSYERIATVDVANDRLADGKMGEDSLIIEHADGSYTAYDSQADGDSHTFDCENLVCAYYSSFLNGKKALLIWYQGDDGTLKLKALEDGSDEYLEYDVLVDESNAYLDTLRQKYSGGYIEFQYVNYTEMQAETVDGDTYIIVFTITEMQGNTVTLSTNHFSGVVSGSTIARLDNAVVGYTQDGTFVLLEGIATKEATEIALPDGYIAEDIADMYVINYQFLIMDDGNIFCYTNNGWEEENYLSELFQTGHILRFMENATNTMILCDDGYVYQIKW